MVTGEHAKPEMSLASCQVLGRKRVPGQSSGRFSYDTHYPRPMEPSVASEVPEPLGVGAGARDRPRHLTGWVALGGFVLWLVGLVSLWLTGATTLVPSVIFVGSFLSPVVFSVWLHERQQFGSTTDQRSSALSVPLLFVAFVGAGLVALSLSALVETFLLSRLVVLWFPGVALTEETVKLAMVWLLARRLPRYTRRDGMLLGAVVGLGYGAFESAGYAFNVLLNQQTRSQAFLEIINVEVTRGLLISLCHGMWTALAAGALFAAVAGGTRLRITRSVLGWWLVVIGLHTFWNWSAAIAVTLTGWSTGTSVVWATLLAGELPNPTLAQQMFYMLYTSVVLAVSGGLTVWLTRKMWRSRGVPGVDLDGVR